MGAGVQLIRSLPGVFSVDLLRLRSPAPLPLPRPSGGGEVSDAGRLGHSSVRGVRVRLRGPSWLVLGEGFSKGWQATCDGRSLGPPRPIDGYANGWRAPADCRRVAFSYGPQRAAVAAYVASALVCALLVAFMLVLWLRHRGPRAAPVPPLLPEERPRRLPLPRAAAIALAATIPLCLLFALRTSLVTFPILTLILWRGVGARPLTGVAAGLLGLVVPVVYAVTSPKDTGGFNFEYSLDLIWAHWAGVAALILLMVACWRMLAAAWRHRRPSRPPPSDTSPDRVERDERSLELAGAGRRVE